MRMARGLIRVFILCLVMNGASAELSLPQLKDIFDSLKPNPGGKIPLLIPEDYARDALPDNINPAELIKELGPDYDPHYTALTRAEVDMRKGNESQQEHDQNVRKSLVKTMPEDLRQLDFRMPGDGRNLGPKASRKLQLWLWKLSSCSVISKWKDSGPRFWPRWRNHGRCSKKPTCSFPKGMKCKKSKTKRIGVLRWYCNRAYLRKMGKPCIWIKFYVSVITECSCQCSRREGRA